MSKALAVLKLFFSLVSINSTAKSPTNSHTHTNSTIPITQAPIPMPLLINPVDSLSSFVGQAFEFKVPDDTFHPIGKVKLSMWTVNKGPISSKSWLGFDSKTSRIYGLPLQGNAGKFRFYMKATNEQGISAEDVIHIHVRNTGGQYNHEFVIKTAFELSSFVSNLEKRFVFVKRLAKYTFRTNDVTTIWIKSYNKDRQQITIAFNTIRYSPCNKDELKAIREKFVTSSGKIRDEFQRALSNKYPITDVTLRYFGPCDPPTEPPPPPFEWGILKHLMPILMLLFVIGLPVGISCIVRKRSERRRAKLLDQLRKKRREEENGFFTFHTVHYNNRYPSMLSMSNNSRDEEQTIDLDNSKNMANGSVPSVNINRPTTVLVNNSPTNNTIAASPKNERAAGTQNIENKPINVDIKKQNSVNFDKPTNQASRIVYMGKSDMNIPVFYTKPKQEEPQSESSFFGLAETISTTIRGIGKSVLNIAGQGEEEPHLAEEKSTTNNTPERNPKENNIVLLSSELQLPSAIGGKKDASRRFSVQNIDTEIGKVSVGSGALKRSRSEMRLSDLAQHVNYEPDYGTMFDERSNIAGTLMSPSNVRLPMRGISMPHLDMASHTDMHSYPEFQLQTHETIVPLKSCLKNSQSTMALPSMYEHAPPLTNRMLIGDLTHQIDQMSREMRKDFGNKGKENVHYTNQYFDSAEHCYHSKQTGYTCKENVNSTAKNASFFEGLVYSDDVTGVHPEGQIVYTVGQNGGGTVYPTGKSVYSGDEVVYSGNLIIYSNDQASYAGIKEVCPGRQTIYSDDRNSYHGVDSFYSGVQPVSSVGDSLYSVGQPIYSDKRLSYTANEKDFSSGQGTSSSGQVYYSDGQTVHPEGGHSYGAAVVCSDGRTTSPIEHIGQMVYSDGETTYASGDTSYTRHTIYSSRHTNLSDGVAVISGDQSHYTAGEYSYAGKDSLSSENSVPTGIEKKSTSGVDKDGDLSIDDEEAMDYTTWRRRKIKQAEREAELRKSQTVIKDEYPTGNEQKYTSDTPAAYEDYTNPYQYANGSTRIGRTQSSYFLPNEYGWTEDYQKDNRYKQQTPSSPLNSGYSTHSMPSLVGDHNHFNTSRADYKNKFPYNDKTTNGKFKPEQNKNLNMPPEQEDGSLVGFLKTAVGGILGPPESSSWFK